MIIPPFRGLTAPDKEKHPSSLAALAEIVWGFAGNIFKWFLFFYDAFGGKQKKLDIIDKFLCFKSKNVLVPPDFF